jgi:hypothetical protein
VPVQPNQPTPNLRGGAWFEHDPRQPPTSAIPSHRSTNTPPHPARTLARPAVTPPTALCLSLSARSSKDGVPNPRRCHGQVSSQLPAGPPLRLSTDPGLQRYGILEAWYGRHDVHPAHSVVTVMSRFRRQRLPLLRLPHRHRNERPHGRRQQLRLWPPCRRQ